MTLAEYAREQRCRLLDFIAWWRRHEDSSVDLDPVEWDERWRYWEQTHMATDQAEMESVLENMIDQFYDRST